MNGADHDMGMCSVWLAVGERSRDGGVSYLNCAVWLWDVKTCDDIDVAGIDWSFEFVHLQHGNSPLGVWRVRDAGVEPTTSVLFKDCALAN